MWFRVELPLINGEWRYWGSFRNQRTALLHAKALGGRVVWA